MATESNKFQFTGFEKFKIALGIIFFPWFLIRLIAHAIKQRKEKIKLAKKEARVESERKKQSEIAQEFANKVIQKDPSIDLLKTLLFLPETRKEIVSVNLKRFNDELKKEKEQEKEKPTGLQLFFMNLILKANPKPTRRSFEMLSDAYKTKAQIIKLDSSKTKAQKSSELNELGKLYTVMKTSYGRRLIDKAKKYYREIYNFNKQLKMIGESLKSSPENSFEPVYIVVGKQELRTPINFHPFKAKSSERKELEDSVLAGKPIKPNLKTHQDKTRPRGIRPGLQLQADHWVSHGRR